MLQEVETNRRRDGRLLVEPGWGDHGEGGIREGDETR